MLLIILIGKTGHRSSSFLSFHSIWIGLCYKSLIYKAQPWKVIWFNYFLFCLDKQKDSRRRRCCKRYFVLCDKRLFKKKKSFQSVWSEIVSPSLCKWLLNTAVIFLFRPEFEIFLCHCSKLTTMVVWYLKLHLFFLFLRHPPERIHIVHAVCIANSFFFTSFFVYFHHSSSFVIVRLHGDQTTTRGKNNSFWSSLAANHGRKGAVSNERIKIKKLTNNGSWDEKKITRRKPPTRWTMNEKFIFSKHKLIDFRLRWETEQLLVIANNFLF